jgi:hypothetical protein
MEDVAQSYRLRGAEDSLLRGKSTTGMFCLLGIGFLSGLFFCSANTH